MRIPFPKAIPLRLLLIVLALVLLIQLSQGTNPAFAVLMMIAQIAAAVAFNCLGGMTHATGASCLFAILSSVTVAELAHLILGQPGDFNLMHPLTTAGVCALFFISLMTAAMLVSSLNHPAPLIERIQFSVTELRIISGVSCIFASLIAFRLLTLNQSLENGSLLAALNHFYPFLLTISVMLSTYEHITSTDGKSAMNWYIAFLLILAILPGVLTAGKTGMLTPLLSWFVVVASSRYRFTWYGTLGVAAVLFLAWTYVFPFSQNARFPVRAARTLSEKVSLVVAYFRDPSQFPDTTSNFAASTEFGTATSKVGIVQRYSMLWTIDALIDADRKLGYTSIDRYAPLLVSMVPHALWPDRPAPITDNELGHKAGILTNGEDTTTGIAIGAPALFFDLGGWLALIVYTLICYGAFFIVMIRLVGTSESGVWGLVPIGTVFMSGGSPGDMFQLVVMFTATFLTLIAILKVISSSAEALISRPIATRS